MAESLETILLRRLSEIASEESDLRAKLHALAVEQEKYRTAADAIGVEIPPDLATSLDEALNDPYPLQKRKVSQRTIKEAILEILKDSHRPLTALEILPLINDRLSADYPRSSLSPQLSRLKAEGLIDRVGRDWTLASPGVQEDEAADTVSDEDAPAASVTDAAIIDGGVFDQPSDHGRQAVEG